jgi:hypothetical protein
MLWPFQFPKGLSQDLLNCSPAFWAPICVIMASLPAYPPQQLSVLCKWQVLHLKMTDTSWALVAHACNPSYVRGWDQEDGG